MKVVHGSLKSLMREVKDHRVDAVRVAAFMQSDVVTNGMPRYTAGVVVTAVLDCALWTEWRLLVGRGQAEVTGKGVVVPPTDRRTDEGACEGRTPSRNRAAKRAAGGPTRRGPDARRHAGATWQLPAGMQGVHSRNREAARGHVSGHVGRFAG